MAEAGDRRDKSANHECRCNESAKYSEIDGATQEKHLLRERGGQCSGWINRSISSPEGVTPVDYPLQSRDENRQKAGHGTQHKRCRRRVRNCLSQMIYVSDESQYPQSICTAGPEPRR